MSTQIEWTDATWNPVIGCTKVSPGCAYCYAERVTNRFAHGSFDEIVLHPERLEASLHWRKPRWVFVNSMSDLFHEDMSEEFIADVFAVMLLTPQHTYQVLTKRPERMRSLMQDFSMANWWRNKAAGRLKHVDDRQRLLTDYWNGPLPNVWLGVSAENQTWADERIPILLDTPAAVRFVSIEPHLGPIDLFGDIEAPGPAIRYEGVRLNPGSVHGPAEYDKVPSLWLDWVIGGESGGPEDRRLVAPACECGDYRNQHENGEGYCAVCRGAHQPWPACKSYRFSHLEPSYFATTWVRSLRDQCQSAGVPFFFKQWGGPTPKSGGRLLDGREWSEYPT